MSTGCAKIDGDDYDGVIRLAIHSGKLHLLVDSLSSEFKNAGDTIANMYITIGNDLTTRSCLQTTFAQVNGLTWTDDELIIYPYTSADISLGTATGILIESSSQMSTSSSTVMLTSGCGPFTASGTAPPATSV